MRSTKGFPGGSVEKTLSASTGNARDSDSVPGLEDPWRRKWHTTPVFLLGNPTDKGTWWATDHAVAKNVATVAK